MRCKRRPFCGVIYTIKERCFLPGVVPQWVARGQIIATRSERTGFNIMIQHLEELWHQVHGKHKSIAEVFKSHKRHVQERSGLQPY
jgi:hypothetical protein